MSPAHSFEARSTRIGCNGRMSLNLSGTWRWCEPWVDRQIPNHRNFTMRFSDSPSCLLSNLLPEATRASAMKAFFHKWNCLTHSLTNHYKSAGDGFDTWSLNSNSRPFCWSWSENSFTIGNTASSEETGNPVNPVLDGAISAYIAVHLHPAICERAWWFLAVGVRAMQLDV